MEISLSRLATFGALFAVIGGYFLWYTFAANPNLSGDVNNDNVVNSTDLNILVSHYNTTDTTADLNSDSKTNVLDLSKLVAHWGQTYTPPSGGGGGTGSLGMPKFGQSIDGNDFQSPTERQNFMVAAFQDMHVKFIRHDCGSTSGAPQIAFTNKFTAVGMRPICIIGDSSSWNYPTSHPTSEMASRCSFTAQTFPTAIVEPLNEPDLHGWFGHFDAMASYQKACWDAVKAVRSTQKVITPGLWDGNDTDATIINNVEAFYNAGGGQWTDAMNIHCYNDPQSHGSWSMWDQTFGSGGAGYYDSKNIRSVMNAHGFSSQPIICTEGGDNSSKTGLSGQSTIYQHSMATVDGVGTGYRKLAAWTAFTLFDDSYNCCTGFGELNSDRSHRPSYDTFKSLAIQAGQ